MNANASLLLPLMLTAATFAAGCGTAMYQASAGTRFDADSGREVNDADVSAAFAASPQITIDSKVAYYTFDEARSQDIEKMLANTPHVSGVYKIPALLVTGQRHFQETGAYAPPVEVSVKKLRLFAARAHADILLVFDHGYRGGGVNALAALNVLLVPMLVTPWLSNETESYAQAYVIDVRNGYLYGDVTTDEKSGDHFVTIYGKKPADVADEQWPKLLADVQSSVGKALAPTGAARAVSPQ